MVRLVYKHKVFVAFSNNNKCNIDQIRDILTYIVIYYYYLWDFYSVHLTNKVTLGSILGNKS